MVRMKSVPKRMKKNIDILEHNRVSWNRQANEGCEWSKPVDTKTIAQAKRGNWKVILTPLKSVPEKWFGEIRNKNVLCLASGGGQQAPILAAAGANVVSFDNSDEQLKKDKLVADQNGLFLKTIRGDMADLSVFSNDSFDLIFHPASNVFAPDVKIVWRECFRVINTGCSLLSGFMNPVYFLFDAEESVEKQMLKVKYKLPYSDIEQLDSKRQEKLVEEKTALEFGHSLDDQIAGQIEAGFYIAGFYEDWWSDEATLLNKFAPTFIATRAIK